MMGRVVLAIAVGALVVAGVGTYAAAQHLEQTIPAKLIMVRFGGSPPTGRLAKFVSKGAFTLPDQIDGGLTDGSVTFDYGTLGKLTCTLPQQLFDGMEGWKGLGSPSGSKGFVYINKNAPGGIAGPCKIVILKENVIKILAKGTGGLLPPRAPGHNPGARVVLAAGWATTSDLDEMRYCACSVGGTRIERWYSLIRDKDAPAPPACDACDSDGDGFGDSVDSCPNTYNPVQTGVEDNRDGTVTDSTTCLMWEKKDSDDATSNPANLHDVDNRYTWAGCCDGYCSTPDDYCQPNAAAAAACSAQTGGAVGCSECSAGPCEVDPYGMGAVTTIWHWLVQVNAEGGSGFAGYSDWRLPSEEGCNSCWEPYECPCDPAELETILLGPYPCGTSPCIGPIFGPTASSWHWSSGTYASYPSYAWFVGFGGGDVDVDYKDEDAHVRAVRGGGL